MGDGVFAPWVLAGVKRCTDLLTGLGYRLSSLRNGTSDGNFEDIALPMTGGMRKHTPRPSALSPEKMCGIAAIFAYGADAPPVDRAELRRIRDRMIPRGPDGCGEWFSDDGRVGLGHRRLSIIDLNERASQPMFMDTV